MPDRQEQSCSSFSIGFDVVGKRVPRRALSNNYIEAERTFRHIGAATSRHMLHVIARSGSTPLLAMSTTVDPVHPVASPSRKVSFSSIIAATTAYLFICGVQNEDPTQFFSSSVANYFCILHTCRRRPAADRESVLTRGMSRCTYCVEDAALLFNGSTVWSSFVHCPDRILSTIATICHLCLRWAGRLVVQKNHDRGRDVLLAGVDLQPLVLQAGIPSSCPCFALEGT